MEGMEFASLSLIVLVVVFAIGALKKNPLHIGILAMLAAFILGKIAGVKEVAIMGYFPTTLFVRVFGIMFFFAIAQANGAIELLARKMIAKTGRNTKLMPIFIFYVGVILASIGINSLAGMAILSFLWLLPLTQIPYSMAWLVATVLPAAATAPSMSTPPTLFLPAKLQD